MPDCVDRQRSAMIITDTRNALIGLRIAIQDLNSMIAQSRETIADSMELMARANRLHPPRPAREARFQVVEAPQPAIAGATHAAERVRAI